MYVVVRELRHCFHDDRKFLHARDILDHVKLGPSDSNVPEEMQEQIVSGAHTVHVSDRGILCAWIGRHHHLAFLFRLNELLCDVALDDFVREVPTQGVATESIDLKALLQCQTARLEADVHEPGAREVGVSEYRDHQDKSTVVSSFGRCILSPLD
jgi:hypothetical protein